MSTISSTIKKVRSNPIYSVKLDGESMLDTPDAIKSEQTAGIVEYVILHKGVSGVVTIVRTDQGGAEEEIWHNEYREGKLVS